MRYAEKCCEKRTLVENGDLFYVFSGPGFMGIGEMSVKVPAAELKAYYDGKLIQDAMPSLSVDEREFLISGCTPEYWKAFEAD